MNFEIETCPLCGEKLNLRKTAGIHIYSCPTKFQHENHQFHNELSHYQVVLDEYMPIQHIYIYPYAVDNYNDKSKIYKYIESGDGDTLYHELIHVVTTPQIHADTEEKMSSRLQMILTFL